MPSSAAVAAMREGDDPRLTLEVALLKVATPSLDSSREALLRRIESLEARLTEGAAGAPSPEGPARDESASRAESEVERPIGNREPSGAASPATPSVPDVPEQPEPEASVATASVDIERVVELWPAVVDHLRDSGSAMLSTLFDEAKPLGIDEERSVLRIGFPPSAKFNKKKAESKANVERMTEALASIAGQRLRPTYELIDGQGEGATPEESAEISEDELVDLVKDSFDANEVVPSEVVPDDARERESGTG